MAAKSHLFQNTHSGPCSWDRSFLCLSKSAGPQCSGVTVRPQGNSMAYKVAYCSANETFGFHSQEEWFEWLKKWKKEVEQPIAVVKP